MLRSFRSLTLQTEGWRNGGNRQKDRKNNYLKRGKKETKSECVHPSWKTGAMKFILSYLSADFQRHLGSICPAGFLAARDKTLTRSGTSLCWLSLSTSLAGKIIWITRLWNRRGESPSKRESGRGLCAYINTTCHSTSSFKIYFGFGHFLTFGIWQVL